MANARNKWLIGIVSAATISGAALWEGKRNDPYIPVPGDVPTVCYGETSVVMRHYTDAECTSMLKRNLVKYGDGVLRCIDVPINENEHTAYTLFAYNVGVYSFCHSVARNLLNAGQHAAACKSLSTKPNGTPAWSTSGGVYYPGLQRRRKSEEARCLKPVEAK